MIRRHRISSAAVAGALSVVTVGAILAPAASASSPTCFGKKPTAPVLTKNNKTLKGTKGNDVLIATGKNDTITGGDGKDRICGRAVKLADGGAGDDQIMITSGKAKGGLGNDKLTQKSGKTGKVSFDGGPGTDTLTLSKKASAGSTADGGADADKITVPGSLLNVAIPHTSGDVLNGFVVDIHAPASVGPTFEASVNDSDLGGAPIIVEGLTPSDPITDLDSDGGVSLSAIYYPAGRVPGTWAVNFGDGDVRTGVGVPPNYFAHSYVGNGTHTVSVTLTDNLGGTTTQAGPVTSDATQAPSLTLGAPTVDPGNNKTITWPLVTQTPVTGETFAPITSYLIEFGDGTQQVGTTPPPSVTHTYPAEAIFTPRVSYEYTSEGVPQIRQPAQSTFSVGSGTDSFLSLSVAHGLRSGTSAQIIETSQLLSVNASYSGPSGTITLDPGLGGTPFKGSSTAFSYPTAGTYTLTATLKVTGQPDKVVTLPITVRDVPAISLSGPLAIEEGPATFAISAAPPAGAKELVTYPGHVRARVGSSFPSSVSPVLSTTDQYILAEYYNDQLPLTDVTDLQYDVSATAQPLVSTRGLTLGDLMIYLNDSGYHAGEASVATVPDAVSFSAIVYGTLKAKLASESLDAGNGLVKTGSGDVQSRFPELFQVVFPTPADHQIVLTARDTAGRAGRAFGTLSTSGELLLTGPTAAQNATAGTPFTLTGVSSTIGANAKPLSWSVDWDDSTPPSQGYGALPANLTHTYASSESSSSEDVFITVRDDHGQRKTVAVEVDVA